MTIYLDDNPLADDIPRADAVDVSPPTSASRTPGWIPSSSLTCFSVTPTHPM